MANIDYEPIFHTGPVVSPIPGNVSGASCCRIPGSQQALWVALVDGAWRAYRTKDGYRTLADRDDSVAYLSTILQPEDGPLGPEDAHLSSRHDGHLSSLTVIDGVIYCAVTGLVLSSTPGTRYARIYRSFTQGRSWQLHSILPGETVGPRDDVFTDTFFLSELVVDGDTWGIGYNRWFNREGLPRATARQGFAYSTDRGATWTEVLDVGYYLIGGIYGQRGSRRITKWNGLWLYSGASQVSNGKHFTSPDLKTWTDIGDLGAGWGESWSFPISTPTKLYCLESQLETGASLGTHIRSTTEGDAPKTSTAYSDPIVAFGDPLGLDIHDLEPWLIDLNPEGDPEDPEDHLWVAVGLGSMCSITAIPPDEPETLPSFGDINLVQYRYAPLSVNAGYEYGSVETFDYGRAMASWTDRLTDAGVPIPANDPRRP